MTLWYDDVGRVTSLVRGQVVTEFAWSGPLLASAATLGPAAGEVARTFDDRLRPTSLALTVGQSTTVLPLSFDVDGALERVGDVWLGRPSGSPRVTAVCVRPDPTDVLCANGVKETRTFDPVSGRLTALAVTRGPTSLFSATYTADALGRISTVNEATSSLIRTVTYDGLGRIDQVTLTDTVLGLTVPEADVAFDANGNRTSEHETLDPGQWLYHPHDDRLLGSSDGAVTFTYLNGHRRTRTNATGTTTYDTDGTGQLLAVSQGGTSVRYVLDAGGRRVQKRVGPTTTPETAVPVQGFLYGSGDAPLAELGADGALRAVFVTASRGHVPDAMLMGGATYALVKDHLGSVRRIGTSAGSGRHRAAAHSRIRRVSGGSA